jgi:ABC-2 type transport system ATP-binding protein
MSSAADVVIEARGLAKTYRVGFLRRKVEALRDATFAVRENEIFGLIGPNGCGKTTTLKILTGLVSPDAGTATLLGRPIGVPEARRELGYLPESPYFYDHLTVTELLAFHGTLCGMTSSACRTRADELIERVGLSDARDRPLGKFSKGMRQRAGLASALLHRPKLVILDEPQSGLDPIGRAEITRLIRELKAEGSSVFLASHILHDVERVCDRVAVMIEGRVVDVGRLDQLLETTVLEVEIVAEGLSDELRVPIEELGVTWHAAQADGPVRLTALDSEVAGRALEMVVRSGAGVRRYHEHRERLEDLFVRRASKGGTG